jgi:hypothetical protein
MNNADHHFDGHIESDEKESYKMTLQTAEVQKEENLFKVWERCSSVKCFYDEVPRDLHGLAKILYEFFKFIQVGFRMTLMAVESLGPINALVAMDNLAEKLEGIKNPEGYLMSMMKSYHAGQKIAGGRIKPEMLQT